MGDRPKWMPSVNELLAALDIDSYIPGREDFPNTEVVLHRTGLRAQIAALEDLIEGHEGSAMVDRAKKRIEELRKELDG